MTDTVRVPKALSDWLYGAESYGIRVERLAEELHYPGSVTKVLPWLVAAFEVGLAASPQGEEGPSEVDAAYDTPVKLWNLRTPPAMSADHIGDADKMAHVLRGMVNRGTLIDAEAIDRALTLAVYRQDPDDDDRAWAASQAEVIGQLVVPVGSGDADKMGAPVEAAGWRDIANAPRDGTRFLAVMSGFEPEIHWWDVKIGWCVGEGIYRDPEHWQPLPPPPSAHPTPIKPSADTGELRERVTQIIEAAIERHNPGNAVRHTLDDADEILNLIQSERAG